jgi:hypothetical protein
MRPFRERAIECAWLARVRGARFLPVAVTASVLVIAAREGLPAAPRRAVQAAPHADHEPWRDWRKRLAVAHEYRREGQIDESLLAYDRVSRAVTARPADRHRARFWHARMRLERGESSAMVDLLELVRACDDPLLVARAGVLAARAARDTAAPDETSTRMLVVRGARASLRSMSRVSNEHGRRAERWLDYFERTCAPIFFR